MDHSMKPGLCCCSTEADPEGQACQGQACWESQGEASLPFKPGTHEDFYRTSQECWDLLRPSSISKIGDRVDFLGELVACKSGKRALQKCNLQQVGRAFQGWFCGCCLWKCNSRRPSFLTGCMIPDRRWQEPVPNAQTTIKLWLYCGLGPEHQSVTPGLWNRSAQIPHHEFRCVCTLLKCNGVTRENKDWTFPAMRTQCVCSSSCIFGSHC